MLSPILENVRGKKSWCIHIYIVYISQKHIELRYAVNATATLRLFVPWNVWYDKILFCQPSDRVLEEMGPHAGTRFFRRPCGTKILVYIDAFETCLEDSRSYALFVKKTWRTHRVRLVLNNVVFWKENRYLSFLKTYAKLWYAMYPFSAVRVTVWEY